MTRFHRTFLRDRLPQRVYAGAFGKHPAWNDHIDDVGLTTRSLVQVRQILYLDGIGGQLAAGAWEGQVEAGEAPEFSHRFVWEREEQSIVGGIWPSQDGKGRRKFPLVLCLQSELNGFVALARYLPAIDQGGDLCLAAATQETFRAAVHEIESASPATAPTVVAETLAEDARRQILQELAGVASALNPGRPPADGCVSLRLPRHFPALGQDLSLWSGWVNEQSKQPCLALAQNACVDLLIGEPTRGDFFCLRASLQAQPASSFAEAPAVSVADAYLDRWQASAVPVPRPRKSWWKRW